MKTLQIYIKEKSVSCHIVIGSNLIGKLSQVFDFSGYSSIVILTDSNVGQIYLEKIKQNINHQKKYSYIFIAGEKNKNFNTVIKIYKFLAKHTIDRKALIVNLGGGVVTDLGGFVAATYLRGIDFINVSTSITGMVDASIGGKVGIDLGEWKNYVGSFYQPKLILMDIDTLSTLPKRDYIEGFGEIIKHGLILDSKYFNFITSKEPLLFTKNKLEKVIYRSCEIKSKVVKEDEKEKEMRRILNFGHTAGHAIESLSLKSNHPLLHGEAVALGMIVASKISEFSKLITHETANMIENQIQKSDLPTKIPFKISSEDIIEYISKDKKTVSGKTNWILLQDIGKAIIDQHVSEKIVIKALSYVIN